MLMQSDYDRMFMQHAISLATKGWGRTGINPLVGAVVVRDNQLIGQGHHRKIGEAHAEANALIDAGNRTKDATLYVNLEPCCCFGRTPPCVEAISNAGIKRVVIGTIDPNPAVNGRSVEFLKQNRIEVTLNVLKNEADQLNLSYKKFITQKIPYIVLKIAASEDHKISGFKEKYITSESSQRFVHALRSQVDAILVGINTILIDNPYLTDRLVGRNNPARIVLDPNLKIPLNANFLKPDSRRIIVTSKENDPEKIRALTELGVEFVFFTEKQFPLLSTMQELGTLDIGSILIEGGGKIFAQSLKEKIADEIYIFIAPKTAGPGITLDLNDNILNRVKPTKIGEDLLYHVYRNN